MALRSLIVDDNAHFLAAARDLLERQPEGLGGRRGDAHDLDTLPGELRPDVALVNIDLGHESGLDLARQLAGDGQRPRVVMISAYSENDFADLIAASPAAGFLPKAELSAARIQEVLRTGDDRH